MKTLLFLFLMLSLVPVQAQEKSASRLKEQLDSVANKYGISSIGYALVRADSLVIADAVGVRSYEKNEPADKYSVYRIGSVTKSFVALGVMKLAEEGKIDLNAPLKEVFPDLPIQNPWEATHPVLVNHLLEHTAGFRDLYLADNYHDDAKEFPSLKEVVYSAPDYWISRWPPGTRHAYSNRGYTLLGLLIEQTTGMSYVSYLEKVLLKPLGMESSDLLGRDLSNLAYSYTSDGHPDFPGIFFDHPAGYMHTTPADMAIYARFLLNDTRLPDSSFFLKPDRFASMHKPESISGANGTMIGYGKGFGSTPDLGFGHDGAFDSYLSLLMIYPSQKLAYYFSITSMNEEGNNAVREILQAWLNSEEPAITPKQLEAGSYVLPETYLGWYKSKVYRNQILRFVIALSNFGKLQYEGDTLVFKSPFDEAVVLSALGNGYFSTNKANLPTIYIGEEDGQKIISGRHGPLAGYMVQSSFLQAASWLLLLGGGLALFIGSYLVTLVNLLIAIAGSYTSNKRPMVWMVLSALWLIPLFYGLFGASDPIKVSHANVYSLSLAFSTIGFGLMWLLGIWSFRFGNTHQKHWRSIPLWAGYVGWFSVLLVLAAFDFLPLLIWKM
jgi:CubicO group peptidase (beta-lactamase class C family)